MNAERPAKRPPNAFGNKAGAAVTRKGIAKTKRRITLPTLGEHAPISPLEGEMSAKPTERGAVPPTPPPVAPPSVLPSVSQDGISPSRGEIGQSLPALIDKAAKALAGAKSAGEVLEARDMAGLAYDAARRAARLMKAKGAHDELVAATHRAQADALEIEAQAKRRLADEYDAAQERGEVGKKGQRTDLVPDENKVATAEDVGLTRKDVHDARQVRDVIEQNPRAVRAALDDIIASGDEPTRAALKRAIAPAAKALRAEEQTAKKARRVEREAELGARQVALPEKKYGVIYADPEWRFQPYSRETGMDRAPDNHYPTSELADIKARDVGAIAAPDCVLFLWATAPLLPAALEVMAAWGFAYVTHMVWVKERPGEGRGTGYWFLGEHELLLVGKRGDVPAPAPGTQARSVIAAPVGEHSEKPEVFAELIERYFPNLPKIELNARKPRPGWDVWGFEAAASPESSSPRLRGEDRAAPRGEAERLADLGEGDEHHPRRVRPPHRLPALLPASGEKDARRKGSRLPPAPGQHHVEFSVGGMKKGSFAKFCVRRNDDGTFATSLEYQLKGWMGASSPFSGDFATFAELLAHALDWLRSRFGTALDCADDGVATKHHRAAAKAGVAWIDARAAEWGVAIQAVSVVSKEELAEYKMLGALDAGVTVRGALFDHLYSRGLIFGNGLSIGGAKRLAELEARVKAASDGDAVRVAPVAPPSVLPDISPSRGEIGQSHKAAP